MTREADMRLFVEPFWAALSAFDAGGGTDGAEPGADGAGADDGAAGAGAAAADAAAFDAGPMREGYERFADAVAAPEGMEVKQIDAGGVPVDLVTTPGCDVTRTVLWCHGGGYVVGSPRTHRSFAGWLSQRAGVRVLLPDYRLAPEHVAPAALEDITAVYRWLLADGGLTADAIVVGGESSGAGLATASLMALRDASVPLPVGLALVSPWADIGYEEGSRVSNADSDPISSIEAFASLAPLLLGDLDPRDPRVSPVHGDFRDFPPALVQVGDGEVVVDDARRIADGIRAAGGAAELELWPEMVHNTQIFTGLFPPDHDAWRALDRLAAFIRERLIG